MAGQTFSLSSSAFQEGGAIPREHSCDGANSSPPLEWSGVPSGAQTLALIVDDPDARGFVHWVAYNIPAASSGSLAAGASGAGQVPGQGQNSFGASGYGGPCPPSGMHHYVFRMLALDTTLSIGARPAASDVLQATTGHVVGEARLTGTYSRGG